MFQDAVAKYEVVLQNLDFARDLHKQFQMMLLEVCRSLISSADDYNNSWWLAVVLPWVWYMAQWAQEL